MTRAVGAATALSLFLLCGCSQNQPAEKPKTYPLRGYVVRLDKKTNLATIHNEPVPGWMGEMTMAYPVESRPEYMSLVRGEKISATVNVTSEGFWLTGVKERKD